MNSSMQNVFIIGSKGIPAAYGGFESFVDRLTCYKSTENIKYHVSCAVEPEKWEGVEEFEYNNARCFNVKWKKLGPARAIFYDLDALKMTLNYISQNGIEGAIVYILACRIGPFMKHYVRKIHKLGAKVYVNPDGHEWKRAKWSAPVRAYWKYSEKLMVKYADLLICDSKAIEKYIKSDYALYQPRTKFIAYGSETKKSILKNDDEKISAWYKKHNICPKQYFLVVGRFVPENNYEIMIKEFMKSDTHKDFVLITNVENNSLYNDLLVKTHMDHDKRIKFVGTVYDQELLKKIRENAYGYFHGHEVGGTNPSLLEALGSTDLNMLLDVEFNREVAEDGAIYWCKEEGSLSALIKKADAMNSEEIQMISKKARARIDTEYSWNKITHEYENVFLKREEP